MSKADTFKWYEFRQNNTGGDFEVDENVTIKVFIEAASSNEANSLAENVGIYYDGSTDGVDCPCCGDRWYEVTEGYKKATITYYDPEEDKWAEKWKTTSNLQLAANHETWVKVGQPAIITYDRDNNKTIYKRRKL
jgi:hypothetical protein